MKSNSATTRMPSDQQQQLAQTRAIVALNNAAVTLMERGHAVQALQVLTDLTSSSFHHHNHHHNLSQQVYRAVTWCQQPANDVYVMDVHVLEQDDVSAWTDAVMYGPSSSMVFALQMSHTTMHTVSPAIITSMMLHNTAMAHRCHYAETDQLTSLKNAQQALHACQQVLQNATNGSNYLVALVDCALERVVQEQLRHEAMACASCSSNNGTSCWSQATQTV